MLGNLQDVSIGKMGWERTGEHGRGGVDHSEAGLALGDVRRCYSQEPLDKRLERFCAGLRHVPPFIVGVSTVHVHALALKEHRQRAVLAQPLDPCARRARYDWALGRFVRIVYTALLVEICLHIG